MSATEQDIQTPGRAIFSLGFFAYNALGDAPVKNPGLFKEFPKPCSYAVERYASEDLLHCAGFGMRTKAETTFSAYRRSLLWRGKLTDIAKETYEDITAFEYAVMVKDSHFVRKVVDFLEKYQGEDKREIVANLLEQFDRYFSEERL